MVENDPILERRAREEKDKQSRTLKGLAAGLAVVAVGLALGLAYVWSQKSRARSDYEEATTMLKTNFTEDLNAIKDSLDLLHTDNAYLSSQLDSSRVRVEVLMEELQKTKAVSYAELQKYKKEVGTLRSIMRNYVDQIDSLNTLNQHLTKENRGLRNEVTTAKRENEELNRKVEVLEEKVATGSTLKSSGISVRAYNKSDKTTDSAKKTKYMIVSFTLNANDLAEQGDVTVYMRVLDPDGILLHNSNSVSFVVKDASMTATDKRTIDYTGSETPVSIYLVDVGEFQKGPYQVEVYTAEGLLGKTSIQLR